MLQNLYIYIGQGYLILIQCGYSGAELLIKQITCKKVLLRKSYLYSTEILSKFVMTAEIKMHKSYEGYLW